MHKPFHTLFFAMVLFLNLGILSRFFPVEGLKLFPNYKLGFPSLSSFLYEKHHKTDISEIIKAAEIADTAVKVIEIPTPVSDTIEVVPEIVESFTAQISKIDTAEKLLMTNLQYKNEKGLHKFFEALIELKSNPKSIRILHYGDSQIEGDRITDYLRLKLQGQFGGHGPGLISLMPISPSLSNRVTWGQSWDRYNVFSMRDKRVSHNNFGVLAGFARFSSYRRIHDSSSVISSEIKITTSKLGGSNATNYKKIKLFYGGAQTKTWCELYDGPALSGADSLEAGGIFRVKEYDVGLGSLTHEFKFRGKDSPDFYAISLESDNGVLVDNIALRGSSGTFYHQINFAQLKQFYDYLNTKLIIVQFGGNALPSIKDAAMAENYASYLRGQISILKKLAPAASIIFIGPADMSVKVGTEYLTHPLLEVTRDAIKREVLESGCVFFDMYDCMGGKNSMASWVEAKMAATDYIHFSPQGARKMATLFYSALINEYNNYLKKRK
jgi:lysophospholipase L1-like esterase